MERDIIGLDLAGGYYTRHVQALTEEKLHAKSDIAAELAWRDQQIDLLKAEREMSGRSVLRVAMDPQAIAERVGSETT